MNQKTSNFLKKTSKIVFQLILILIILFLARLIINSLGVNLEILSEKERIIIMIVYVSAGVVFSTIIKN